MGDILIHNTKILCGRLLMIILLIEVVYIGVCVLEQVRLNGYWKLFETIFFWSYGVIICIILLSMLGYGLYQFFTKKL